MAGESTAGKVYNPNNTNTYRVNSDGSRTEIGNSAMRDGEVVRGTDGRDYQWNSASGGYSPAAAAAPDYSGLFERLNANLGAQQTIASRQITLAEQAASIAQEQYQFWKTNFLPSIKDLIAKSKAGVDAEYVSDIAQDRVERAYDASEGVTRRNLERLGVNPDDELYGGLDDSLKLRESKAVVGARNAARLNAVDANDQLQLQLAGMGLGVPATSLNAYNASSQSMGAAAATRGMAGATMADAMASQLQAQYQNAGLAQRQGFLNEQLRNEAQFNDSMARMQAFNQLASIGGQAAGTYMGYRLSQGPQPGQSSGFMLSSPNSPQPQMTPGQPYVNPGIANPSYPQMGLGTGPLYTSAYGYP